MDIAFDKDDFFVIPCALEVSDTDTNTDADESEKAMFWRPRTLSVAMGGVTTFNIRVCATSTRLSILSHSLIYIA